MADKNKKDKEQQEAQNEPEAVIFDPQDVETPDERESREDREAIEAMRRYTEEDDDEGGEVSFKSIIGGDFLMSRFMIKQVVFVMFCVMLMIAYTANRYDSQQDSITIDSLRVRLQDVKYNVLTQSSELMNMMRQSNVEKLLRGTADSVLRNPVNPPYLLKIDGEHRVSPPKAVREVLVDSVRRADGDEGAGDEAAQAPDSAAGKKAAGEAERNAGEEAGADTGEKAAKKAGGEEEKKQGVKTDKKTD